MDGLGQAGLNDWRLCKRTELRHVGARRGGPGCRRGSGVGHLLGGGSTFCIYLLTVSILKDRRYDRLPGSCLRQPSSIQRGRQHRATASLGIMASWETAACHGLAPAVPHGPACCASLGGWSLACCPMPHCLIPPSPEDALRFRCCFGRTQSNKLILLDSFSYLQQSFYCVLCSQLLLLTTHKQ